MRVDVYSEKAILTQNGFQSVMEIAPLAADSARYSQSVSHFIAKSDTQVNVSKVFYEMFSHFPKTLYIQ